MNTRDKQEADTSDASVRQALEQATPRPAMVAVWQRDEPMCRALLLQVGVPTTLGRGADVAFALPDDERLSRRHAAVQPTGEGFVVEDFGSRNGTYVNGERIARTVTVTGDAVVRVGGTLILLVVDGRRFAFGTVRVEGDRVVGPESQRLRQSIEAAAQAQRSLLIVGESGTGKELAAKDYHAASPLSGGPFVVVNSSAIPDAVAESLLFGAKRGAYTGADRDVAGYFERADGGVLFLDEVGLLGVGVQQKLLRAVETREIWPLGASSGRRVEVTICAATNEDLGAAIDAGRFRADLYQRLAQRTVALPPLRERPEEIPYLVRRAIERVRGERTLHVPTDFVEACLQRRWPTNVRELTSAVEMACEAAQTTGELHVSMLGREGAVRLTRSGGESRPSSVDQRASTAPPPPPDPMPTGRELRREAFRVAFVRHRGHVPSAAAEVGIALSTAYDYARELQGKGLR